MRVIIHLARTIRRTQSGRNRECWQQTERREALPFNTLPFNSYSRRQTQPPTRASVKVLQSARRARQRRKCEKVKAAARKKFVPARPMQIRKSLSGPSYSTSTPIHKLEDSALCF